MNIHEAAILPDTLVVVVRGRGSPNVGQTGQADRDKTSIQLEGRGMFIIVAFFFLDHFLVHFILFPFQIGEGDFCPAFFSIRIPKH